MDKTVVELFAGVGGFRCGLNHVKELDKQGKANEDKGNWEFLWFNQWEPSTKSQAAFDCYVERFGTDCQGNPDKTNVDIAEVNKNKNHKQIIDAIEHLNNRNIKLICAGEGVLLDSIRNEIKERNLQDNIKMLGFRTDVDKIIAACDIGVLMSYREGLPRNIMELMASKKPVIGTNIRGIRDLIEDNKTGYLVEVGDYKSTANKIEKLYNNRNLLKELSKNCYRYIQKYDVNKVVEQLKEIYC